LLRALLAADDTRIRRLRTDMTRRPHDRSFNPGASALGEQSGGKLGLHSNVELARYASENNLVK
jgi:hypothetical protein